MTCELKPTALDIVAEYLKQNGYDGLSADECGCLVSDLAPCDLDFRNCVAGHKVDGCHEDCGMGCDFHVVPGKRPAPDLGGSAPTGASSGMDKTCAGCGPCNCNREDETRI